MLKAEGLMIKDESRKNQAMPQPDSQTQSGPVKPPGPRGLEGSTTVKGAEVLVVVRLLGLLAAIYFSGENQAGSSRIKPNQSKSNQIKPNQTGGDGSAQWPVASGWWRKKAAEYRPVKPSQTESNLLGVGWIRIRIRIRIKKEGKGRQTIRRPGRHFSLALQGRGRKT
jgi:hypothetical protein